MIASLEAQCRALDAALQEQKARWMVLHEVSTQLARQLDDESLLKEIVRSSAALLHARGGGLILHDTETGKLTVQVVYADGRFVPELTGRSMEVHECLAGRVMAAGKPTILDDYLTWEGRVTGFESLTLRPVLAVPLYVEQVIAGVLMVSDRPKHFSEDDVQTLTLFAQQAAAALERTRARRNLIALSLSEERERVARELHDGLAQDLAALLLKADLCRDLASGGSPSLAAGLESLAEGLQRAVRATRATIFSHSPVISTARDLIEALHLLTSRFQVQSGLPVVLESRGSLSCVLPAGCGTALLRMAQEALTNVRKHAGASEAAIVLDLLRPDILELSIFDNGRGINPGHLTEDGGGQHFGLRSMRGRMEDLGGSLQIDGGTGCGTKVTALVPLLPRSETNRG